MVHKHFDKKITAGTVNNEITSNAELIEELRKPINRQFKKRKLN